MNLFWDYSEHKLASALNDPIQPQVAWTVRDTIPVSIAIVEREDITEAFTAIKLADVEHVSALESIIMAGRASVDAGDYSFYEDTFTWNASDTAPRYDGEIDLNQEALINAIGAREVLRIRAQIALEKNDVHYYSTYFPIWIINDVITSAIPPSSAANAPRIHNGLLYIYNEDTGLWYPVTTRGDAGDVAIEVGETGIDLS